MEPFSALYVLFLEHDSHYFTNYVDDTTPYIIGDNETENLTNLTEITQNLFTWFAYNQMKADHDTCRILLSTQDEANIQITNVIMKSSSAKKILEVNVDYK